MRDKNLIWIFLIMVGIAFLFFYMAYLQTFKLDAFTWGNSSNDGLYLLVIPLILLPSIFILGMIKWALVRNSNAPIYLKRSHFMYIALSLLIFIFSSVESYWAGLIVGLFAGVLSVIEPFLLRHKIR